MNIIDVSSYGANEGLEQYDLTTIVQDMRFIMQAQWEYYENISIYQNGYDLLTSLVPELDGKSDNNADWEVVDFYGRGDLGDFSSPFNKDIVMLLKGKPQGANVEPPPTIMGIVRRFNDGNSEQHFVGQIYKSGVQGDYVFTQLSQMGEYNGRPGGPDPVGDGSYTSFPGEGPGTVWDHIEDYPFTLP